MHPILGPQTRKHVGTSSRIVVDGAFGQRVLPVSAPQKGCNHRFSLWTECYASLMAVLVVRYLHKTPQLMVYLQTITHAAHNFDGPAWATYDMAFWRQAANKKSL